MRAYYEIRTLPPSARSRYRITPVINGNADKDGVSYWDHLSEATDYIRNAYRKHGMVCNIIDVEKGLRVTNEIEI